jgi:hypothetical protein
MAEIGIQVVTVNLSLRQWYAGQALAGGVIQMQRSAEPHIEPDELDQLIAMTCFQMADQMIHEDSLAGGSPQPPDVKP